jgi:phage terminase large subunit-like protein
MPMGLTGAHNVGTWVRKTPDESELRKKRMPWKKRGLDRVGRVIAFLEFLPITKGTLAGKPMRLLPGQRQFIEAIYGRLDSSGRRQVRIAIKSEPRGNGKTGLLAGLALCHLLGPECEARGEIYSAAYNKLQAALIFAEMKAIVEAVPDFAGRVNVQRYGKILEVMVGDGAGSTFESLSADDKRAHGLSPSLWIFDEFAQSPNTDLLDNLRTAMGKRSEALGVIISTQAANDQHPLSQMIDDGLNIADPSVYVQLAAAPEDADIFDEATWRMCNEALGTFLDMGEMRSQAEQAKRLPSFEAKFRNLRLNQRTAANDPFVTQDAWKGCFGPLVPLDECEEVWGGLDLSAVADLTALVLIGRHKGIWHIEPHFWLPKEGLAARAHFDRVPYELWARQGHLHTSPGKTVNYDFVVAELLGIFKRYPMRKIGFDRWMFRQFRMALERGGMTEAGIADKFFEFGQGYRSMSPALRTFEQLLLEGKLRHGNNPVMNMCVNNATVMRDPAGNRKLIKSRHYGRIDGMVGLAMAIGTIPEQAQVKPPEYRLFFAG